MTLVKAPSQDGLRSILCLAFDTHAALDDRHALETYLIDRREVLHALEAEGSFDFMIEAKFDGLSHYHQFVDELVSRFASILREQRASFVCRRFIFGADRAIWVKHNGMRVRIDLNRIERVTAEGDYIRLWVGEHDYLHHATMAAFQADLDEAHYARIHRSTIVRLTAIDRVTREDRWWFVRCRDGSKHRVARNYVEPFLRRLESHPTIPRHASAKSASPGELRIPERSNGPCAVAEDRPELLSL